MSHNPDFYRYCDICRDKGAMRVPTMARQAKMHPMDAPAEIPISYVALCQSCFLRLKEIRHRLRKTSP